MKKYQIVFCDKRKKIQFIEAKNRADAIRSCIVNGLIGFAVYKESKILKDHE